VRPAPGLGRVGETVSEPRASASHAVNRRRRGPRPTPVGVVLALGLLAIAIAGVTVLARSEPRRSGTNLISYAGLVIPLAPGQQLCEPGELLPGDTGALRLIADSGAYPGPRLRASIIAPQGPVSSGELKPGWRSGTVLIPLARVARTLPSATVCLRNAGSRAVLFGGSAPASGFVIEDAGKPLSGRLRIEYMRPGSESWLQLLPTLAHRFSLAKSDLVRHWAWVAALVLMLLAVVLAVRTASRAEAPR
jgi:hypothetical protein